jgi:hypothetical protein
LHNDLKYIKLIGSYPKAPFADPGKLYPSHGNWLLMASLPRRPCHFCGLEGHFPVKLGNSQDLFDS